eukprot:gnl/MRDRNA2_/MRDRNA2_27250_c0_seq2.p1 gnl/MRDRNA2_/MRDRNA2_27250_c0~~gnl/MRDRNA2_/MRDRNA2_27250_c0_seq2.p1  ORF type:complete len:658 (+),score=130.17 gnl/MRDRNA2_/MRDRNA2_27250_c0_seq2:119-2092(+)
MQESHKPPHVLGGEPIDYRVVIPTRGRWKEARLISSETSLKKVTTPFILVKTLGFLKRQKVDPRRVTLWTADDSEKERYQEVLQMDEYWAGDKVQVCVGVPGIMKQRNHIVEALPVDTYVVSLDDDLANVFWKKDAGVKEPLVPLPDGSLEPLIYHAYAHLKKYKAWIWGLATTAGQNTRTMFIDGVSTRNGEINGFFYGFINRHDPSLLPQVSDATEDAERSLRYFQKDHILLRYRMYCGDTKCFAFQEGLQGLFEAPSLKEKWIQRKSAERCAADKLHEMFPGLTGLPQEKKGASTLMIKFRPLGGFVLPTSTPLALSLANQAEKASGRFAKEKENSAVPNNDLPEVCSPSTKKNSSAESPGSKEPRADSSKRSRRTITTPKSGGERLNPGTDLHKLPPTSRLPSSSQLDVLRSSSDMRLDSPRSIPSSGAAPFLNQPSFMIDTDSEEDAEIVEQQQAGVDENAEFERVFSQSSKALPGASSSAQARATSAEQEAEMIRRALEESLRDMMFVINGHSADPLADAIAESQEMQRLEQKKRCLEDEQLAASLQNSEFNLEKSLSTAESELGEYFCMAASTNRAMPRITDESPAWKRARKETEETGDSLPCSPEYRNCVNLQRLVEMGFDRSDAQRALRDAANDVELAGAILVSGTAL